MNVESFEHYLEKYEDWFERHRFAYEAELHAVRLLLPHRGTGLEIGVETGRFAVPLGIRIGVEPAKAMRTVAKV